MRFSAIEWFFLVILAFILVVHWKGTQAIFATTFGGIMGTTKALQGR